MLYDVVVCAKEGCEADLLIERWASSSLVAQRVREAGWFIEEGRGLCCPVHLQER
jgi:hypothetical protein